MIPIARLPYSVLIKDKNTNKDDIGMDVETWNTVADIRADIQPLGVTRELDQRAYGIIEAGVTAKMFCNSSSEIQLARRVVHGDKTYEINHVASYRGHVEALLKPVVT